MTTVLSFFNEIQRTEMQQLSLWWYHVNVPRIQNKVKISVVKCHDFVYYLLVETKQVLKYDWWTRNIRSFPINDKMPLPNGMNFIQTPTNKLYVVGGRGPA